MQEAKYIVYMDEEAGTETPVLFPSYVKHSDMARGFDKVLSAGFVSVRGTNATAYGESTSLKKKSDPKRDSCIITRMLFGYQERAMAREEE